MATGASPRRDTRSPAQHARPRPPQSAPASGHWQGGPGRAKRLRCPPAGPLPSLRRRYRGRPAVDADDGAGSAAGDRRGWRPSRSLDFDDDEHLLSTVHLDGQVDAPAHAADEPPLAFWVSRCPREPGQEGGLDGLVECLARYQPLDRHELRVAFSFTLRFITSPGQARGPAVESALPATRRVQLVIGGCVVPD